eukprot:SAG31_NODE_6372_length_2040_cov_4.252962_1_plen_597_part_01
MYEAGPSSPWLLRHAAAAQALLLIACLLPPATGKFTGGWPRPGGQTMVAPAAFSLVDVQRPHFQSTHLYYRRQLQQQHSSHSSCARNSDCNIGEYCDRDVACALCSFITPSECYSVSSCCSDSFLRQCPTNPSACCDRDENCSLSTSCIHGRCIGQCRSDHDCSDNHQCIAGACKCNAHGKCSASEYCDHSDWSCHSCYDPENCARTSDDGATLLTGFVRGPEWATSLSGWRPGSDPCGNPRWAGVSCIGSRVQYIDLHDRNIRLQLSSKANWSQLSMLQYLDVSRNSLLSGTIPPELGQLSGLLKLSMHNSPALSGSIPNELCNIPDIPRLDFHNNMRLSGSLPPLHLCSNLKLLNVANCSMSKLPASLPVSITHLYLNNNPLISDAEEMGQLLSSLPDLHEFDGSFTNGAVQLDTQMPQNHSHAMGVRVLNPTQCRIGGTCTFRLQMYDTDDEPLHQGGLISGLILTMIGSGVETSTRMHDMRDGTFVVNVPTHWINRTGTYSFQFQWQHQPFFPLKTLKDQYGLLPTVTFLPRRCPPGTHTIPDSTGNACVCEPKFLPDAQGVGCHRHCGIRETLSADGKTCVCSGRSYDINTR